MLAYADRNAYRRSYDSWTGDILMSLLLVSSAGKVSEESRKKYLSSLDDQLSRIGDLLSLSRVKRDTEKERKKKEGERLSTQAGYATALASLGNNFTSFEQLEAAIAALNETIRETQTRKTDGPDPGTKSSSD